MASPILNIKIFHKSVPHSLRAISILTLPPGFLILFIQGIASHRVNPAIGILPLFFSSLYSAWLLLNERSCGCQASGLTGTPIHLVCDLLLGCGLLVCLILSWVHLPSLYWNAGLVMLGTYGTNFMITNFVIHCYFVFQQLLDAITPGSNYVMACPQCQYGPFQINRGGSRKGYAPLLDGENREGGYQDYQNGQEQENDHQQSTKRTENDSGLV